MYNELEILTLILRQELAPRLLMVSYGVWTRFQSKSIILKWARAYRNSCRHPLIG